MVCSICKYEETPKGCETPGCDRSIHMTDTVRQSRKREAEEQADRDRVFAIRVRTMGYK